MVKPTYSRSVVVFFVLRVMDARIFLLLGLLVIPTPMASTNILPVNPIKHIIVIMQENHTFDNYFGTYPGVNGLPHSTALPLFPGGLATVKPFHIPNYTIPNDMSHSDNAGREAYNSGKNDGFVYAESSNYTLGYYDHRDLPYYWDYASQFALADNYFTSFMGPSFPNHIYLLAGQSGNVTRNVYNETLRFPSIIDELQAAHISWRYYAGGAAAANGWNPIPILQATIANKSILHNVIVPSLFPTELINHTLPSVVWLMPPDQLRSEHPPYDPRIGEHYVVDLINQVMLSNYWNSTAIFLTWDDYGGWYDHVPPPQVDQHGFGFRVPLLMISPFAKQGYIDHAVASHDSILKFIETTFDLPAMTHRDANAYNLLGSFDFTQARRPALVLPGPFVPEHYPLTYTNGVLFSGGGPPPSEGVGTILKDYLLASMLVGIFLILIIVGWVIPRRRTEGNSAGNPPVN